MTTKSKIYTKTGDQGSTRLVSGECVSKDNPCVEAYGSADELNSSIGELRLRICGDHRLEPQDKNLEKIQNLLFNVGSLLACLDPQLLEKLPQIQNEHIAWLENQIDELDAVLPRLTQFILPYGSAASCAAHVSRTTCRRCERNVVMLRAKNEQIQNCLVFLNRLSDYLFVLSRWCNFQLQLNESVWTKP